MSYWLFYITLALSSIIPNPSYDLEDNCDLISAAVMECCCGEQEEILVPGGDFEIAPFPAPGGWIDYTTGFGPWIVSTGSVSHHDDGHNNLGAGNPNPSTAHLDLNGFSLGGVCQTLNGFTIGQECTIVFYYAIHNAVSSADASLQIDGGAALDVSWNATNVGSVNWLEASYTFIATNTDMDLCFESETFVNCCGMLIDDITMFCCQPVQEDPVLDDKPNDEDYDCINQVPDPPIIGATDDCTADIAVIFNEIIDDADPCYITISRNWETEDECGKTDSHTQLIQVIDTEAPVVLSPPLDLTVTCDDDIESAYNEWVEDFGGADLFDVCNEIAVTAFIDDIPADICSQTLVIFLFTDACGNTIVAEASVIVIDEEEPIFDIPASDLILPCATNQDSIVNAWLLSNGDSEASDNCQFQILNDFSGVYDSTQLVNFSAVDYCGNTTFTSAMLIITNEIDTIQIDSTTCDTELEGIQEIFVENNNGCDSLLIINFSLLQSDTNTVISYTCDPFEAIVDTVIASNIYGCDSISYIEVILSPRDTTRIDLATCDVNDVGEDTLFLQNIFLCDSLVIVTSYLTENDTLINTFYNCDITQEEIITTIIPGAICDTIIIDQTIPLLNDSIEVDAFTCKLSEVGLDTIVETNVLGCDSIIVINTMYEPVIPVTINIESCQATEVSFDTSYVFLGICDSIIIIQTIPLPKDFVEITETTCKLDNTGLDTSIMMNVFGCDSIIVTNTMYEPIIPATINIESCQATEVSFDTSYVSGICDSIIIIQTIPLPKDFIEINETTCKLDNIGLDTSIMMNVYGCDSIIVTNTLYDPPIPLIENAETCIQSEIGSDTSYTYSGICDSIIITNTVLIAENELFLFEKTCDLLIPGNDTLFLQSAQGCDSLIVTEYFNDPLSFDVILDFDPCNTDPNGIVEILNLAGGSSPFLYTINGVDFATNALFTDIDFGNYNAQVIDGDGCLSEIESITFSSTPEIEIELPQQITLSNGQDGQILIEFNTLPDTFYWSNPSVLSCEQCLNPVVSTTESMTLTLFAINESGCISSQSIDILVKEESIYIPNIFSPNGDGINDEFKIFTSDINSNVKTMRIYSRWGNLLFEKLNFQTHEDVYWNGYYNNEPLDSGVYVYYIELESNNGENIIFIGDVTLIR